MATEQEQIDLLRADVSDIKTRLAIAENNIEKIEQKLDKIDTNLNKVMWILITAVLLAVLNVVIKGGIIS
jgi:chromosome segregation ATPase